MVIIFRKMICYGKFNSYRIMKIGMQEVNEMYQFVLNIKIYAGALI